MFFVSISLISVICIIFYWYFTRNFNYWKKRGIVGPKPLPLFGNYKDSARRRKCLSILLHEIYDQYPDEKIVGIYRMTMPALLIRDLDITKHIMIKDFDCFVSRGVEFSKDGLGTNILHADPDSWRVLRACLSPTFSTAKLKQMYYLLVKQVNLHVKRLEDLSTKQSEVNIIKLAQDFNGSAILATAFGIDIGLEDELLNAIHKIGQLILRMSFAVELEMVFPGILKRLQSTFFPQEIATFFCDLVRTATEKRNGEPSGRKDLIDALLAMGKEGDVYKTTANNETYSLRLTEDIMVGQAFLFFAAGFETSSGTASFMLYELAVHPDLQDKVLKEIDEELERSNGEMSFESLMERLPYVNKVFDETLRLHPIVEANAIQRSAGQDYKIPGTDLTIPKGMIVVFSPSGIHMDEKYYPNPTKFDPERFAPEAVRDRHSCAYLPFGVGRRNCIGMRLGRLQTLVFVTKVLSRMRVEPSKNTPLDRKMAFDPNTFTRSPKGGLHLKFTLRK